MRYLKTSEAASVLNVSPHTLRAWERRFGYPKPQRSAGQHRRYTHADIAALRDALRDGLSISSAVSRAREALKSDGSSLVGALAAFETRRADAAMEAALALRDLDRAVEELLLPGVDEMLERHGRTSAQWAFTAAWANDWLRRAARLSAPPEDAPTALIGDATGGELDPQGVHVQALALMCRRAGMDSVRLSAHGARDLTEAVAALRPAIAVVAGDRAGSETAGRWARAVRDADDSLPLAAYRQSAARRPGMSELPASPRAAASRLLELLAEHRAVARKSA